MMFHVGKSGHARRRSGVTCGLLLLGALVLPGEASAAPGDHIRAGEAVITPKVSIGLEQSTNVYRGETNAIGGTNLRVAPGLEVSAAGPDLEFQFHGEYELYQYLQPELRNLSRYNDFQVGATVKALNTSTIGFQLSDNVGLRNYPAESELAQRPFETQFRNALDAGITVRPGSALDIAASGFWTFEDYQVASSGQISGERSFNRKNAFGPHLQAVYKYFPRTKILLDVTYAMNRWEDNLIDAIATDGSGDIGAELAVPNSNMFKVMGGLNGRITERVVLAAMAGFGTGNFNEQSVIDAGGECTTVDCGADIAGLDHLLVDLQMRYEPSKDDRFSIGYQRNFRDAFFTNYVQYDYGFARLDTRLSKRFGVLGEFGARSEGYRGEVARDDLFLVGKGDVSYHLQDWASVQTGVWWTQRASNDDDVEYDDFNFHLLTTITY